VIWFYPVRYLISAKIRFYTCLAGETFYINCINWIMRIVSQLFTDVLINCFSLNIPDICQANVFFIYMPLVCEHSVFVCLHSAYVIILHLYVPR